jgi:hypothetical protein
VSNLNYTNVHNEKEYLLKDLDGLIKIVQGVGSLKQTDEYKGAGACLMDARRQIEATAVESVHQLRR